jgi:hypothetical protein
MVAVRGGLLNADTGGLNRDRQGADCVYVPRCRPDRGTDNKVPEPFRPSETLIVMYDF